MPRKPNYGFERSERERAKQAKKEEKSRRRDEAEQARKASEEPGNAEAGTAEALLPETAKE